MQNKSLYTEDRDDLEFAMEQLEEIITSNRSASRLIGFTTLVHLLVSLVLPVVLLWFLHSLLTFFGRLLPVSAVLETFIVICVILLLVKFDNRIKRGNAIYQEISDELEWKVIRERDEENQPPKTGDPPRLKTRILLREFVLSTRLPLVNSTHSITLYTIVNIALFALNLITSYFSYWRIIKLTFRI
jgi:hypothetical protein